MELYSVVIAVAITAGFLFLCAFGKKVGRFIFLTSKIPGPSLWEMLTVHAKTLLRDGMITYASKLCASYDYKPWGTWTMKLQYVVFVSDCETISAVYKSKSMTDKSDFFYDLASSFTGKSLLTMNGPQYSVHRKIFGVGLRKSLQDNFLRRMPTPMLEFVKALRERASDEKDVDVRHLITWHVVASMVVSFTSVSHAEADRLIQMVCDYMPRGMELIQIQEINPVYYWLFEHFKSYNKQNKAFCFAALEAFDVIWMEERTRAITSSLESNKSAQDQDIFEAVVLSCLSTKNGYEINNEEICAIGRTLLLSSIETTSFVVNTVLLVLALHQDVQQRVYDEIVSVLGEYRPLLSEDLDELVYTEMVIKETLRLFPPGPLLGRSVREETTVNGVVIPAGGIVIINIMSLHRNPEYYPDPLKFDPSRFSSEASKERRPYTYLPFSAGVRSCPGALHAFLMIKLILFHVVKNFRVLPGAKLQSLNDIKVNMYFTMHLEDCSLRLVHRGSRKASCC